MNKVRAKGLSTEVFAPIDANFLAQRRSDGLLICIKTEDMPEFRGVLISFEMALDLAEDIRKWCNGGA